MYKTIKRLLDIIITIIAIFIGSPVVILAGILLKLESKGPIMYYHSRIGKNGKVFKMYKFRTMKIEIAESQQRDYLKKVLIFNDPSSERASILIKDLDPRITKIGYLLRRTAIDELPQFLNVLKGEMSLVGPRPSLPYEYGNFNSFEKRRLEIRPGITGLWQISGRNQLTYEQMNSIDVEYIDNMSLSLDLKILLKTIKISLLGKVS